MSDDEEGQKLGGDTSFDQLMKEAVALKSAQLSRLRPKFDSWPEFHQAGLYYSSNWESLRSASVSDQCAAFDAKKAEGVALLTQGDAQKALYRFEEALCVFRWISSRKTNWKNEGIEDDDLTVHEPSCDSEVRTRVLTAYLNISLCCLRLMNYKDAVKACDEALQIDPENVKALYRKATALAEPSGSDIDDYQEAIKLLKRANQCDPGNSTIWTKLIEYKEFVKQQRIKSKETFHSFFQKPIVVDGDEAPKPAPSVPAKSEADELLEMCNRKLRELKADNRREEARELRAKMKEIEKWKKEQSKAVPHKPDFNHPSEKMKQEAKEFGLDLEDPQVREALALLEKEKRIQKLSQKPSTPVSSRSYWKPALFVLFLATAGVYLWSWLWSAEEELY